MLRYSALATDYDGTLAVDGIVPEATLERLERFREAGGKIILVTGRLLPEIFTVFPAYRVCHYIVAENGALLFDPATGEEEPLAPPPPPRLIEELKKRDVTPLLVGRVIVATRRPHERELAEIISMLHLNYKIIFNKGALMVLPSGINKGIGLKAALTKMHLAPECVVAVGDAENDHSLLAIAGLGAAVSNAIPSLQEEADIVLDHPASAGVAELIEMLLAGDPRLIRRRSPARRRPTPVTSAEESAPAT